MIQNFASIYVDEFLFDFYLATIDGIDGSNDD